ncbi:MAG: hypothetical protein ACQEUG_06700 [Pseudomonadota bacterium]
MRDGRVFQQVAAFFGVLRAYAAEQGNLHMGASVTRRAGWRRCGSLLRQGSASIGKMPIDGAVQRGRIESNSKALALVVVQGFESKGLFCFWPEYRFVLGKRTSGGRRIAS